MKPKLRFPGYEEEWEEKKLGEIFDNISDKKHSELPVLSVTQDKGTIYRDNLEIDIKFDKQSLSTYKKVLPGQFIISLRSFQGGLELSELEGIVSPAYTILNSNTTVDKYFWKFYFKTYNFIQLLKRTTSGIRDGKQISYADFKTIKSSFPSLPEQEKIGEFFSLLDQRIEKQEEKIELMKERKKGWMQKVFNQEIRFKDENGNDYPDWEEKKFGEFIRFINGRAYKQNELLDEGKYFVLRVGNLFTNHEKYYSNLELEDDKYIDDGDLIYAWSATFGPYIWKGNRVIYHYHIWKLQLLKNYNKNFIYQALLNDVHRIEQQKNGGTLTHITKANMEMRQLSLPSLPEQEKIANFLSTQDELIEKEEEKLSLLKEQKKGLLQQMFV